MGSAELSASLRIATFLSGAAFLAYCDGASPGSDTGTPVELGESTIEVLGSSDALAVVRDLEVLSDGFVRVLNSVEPYFIGFGPDGESLGAHGRSGGGPEEFPMPSAFLTGGWRGEAWVFDLRRHAMIRISRPDEDWAEVPLRSASLPLWYPLWASCGENVVRVHDRVRNQLRGFDGSGTEVRPIDLPPVPFTEVSRRQFAGAVFGIRQAELTGDVRIRLTGEDWDRVFESDVPSVASISLPAG